MGANVSKMGPSLAPKGAHRDRKGAQKALILGMGGGQRARASPPPCTRLRIPGITQDDSRDGTQVFSKDGCQVNAHSTPKGQSEHSVFCERCFRLHISMAGCYRCVLILVFRCLVTSRRVQVREEDLALDGGRRRRVLSCHKVGPNWDTSFDDVGWISSLLCHLNVFEEAKIQATLWMAIETATAVFRGFGDQRTPRIS